MSRLIRAKKTNWQLVKRISIDEISIRKGQGNFVTFVSDICEGNLIEMIDFHRSEEVIKVLIKQPIEVQKQVDKVSVNMWKKFPNFIKKYSQIPELLSIVFM